MKLSTASRRTALITLLAIAPWPSMASSPAGRSADVGRMLSVEKGTGIFTLLVSATTSPVTLAAGAALLV